MAEEKAKKPKIDLKARLGKTAAGAPTPSSAPSDPGAPTSVRPEADRASAPPRPSAPQGIAPPPGIAPPAAISGAGGFVNPFAPKPQPVAAPAPKLSAEQQTIKVEVGEELHEERKKASRLAIIVGVVALAAGAGVGFFAGGLREQASRQATGIKGAAALEGEVATTTKKVEELTPILKEVEDGLKAKKFPNDAITKLASFAVPFNAATLEGKSVGNLPPALQTKTFLFLRKCEELEDKKEALKNTLGGQKKAIEDLWKKEEKPVYELAVIFGGVGEGKMLTQVVAIKEPFEVSLKEWPKELPIKVPVLREGRRVEEEKKATKYEKDLTSQTGPIYMPIDPATVAGFTDERVAVPILKAIFDIRMILIGDETPGREKPGLMKEGEELAVALEKLSLRK
jgi:hypothetical protein